MSGPEVVPTAWADLVDARRTLDPDSDPDSDPDRDPDRLTGYPAPLVSERSHRFPPGHRGRVLATTDRLSAAAMAEGYRSAARTAPWPDRLRLLGMTAWWSSVADEIGRRPAGSR